MRDSPGNGRPDGGHGPIITTVHTVENVYTTGRLVGPRGAAARKTPSPAQAVVVERLREQPEPLSLASLVNLTGQHENTLREHLAALVRRGLVRRHRAEPRGRGRPAWLYELVHDAPARTEYAGLAAALAGAIARISQDPRRDAAEAGEIWGREIARQHDAAPLSPAAARARSIEVLDELGFAPETSAEAPQITRLTRCPLLEAAYRHQDVVCEVHLGIVRSLLTEHGADPAGTTLVPFAEPGACLLTVPPVDGSGPHA